MPTLPLDDVTLEYETSGPDDPAAPVVLCVHGVLVDGEVWRPLADRLAARGHRVVVPTLPLGSHRVAVPPSTELSPASVAGMVDRFAVALGLDRVTVVGNDTGGAVTQFLLDRRPAWVARVVLTNCDAFDAFPPPPFGLVFRLLRTPVLLRVLSTALRSRVLRHSPLGYGLLANRLDPATTARWVAPARTDPAVRADLVRLLRAVDPAELDAVTRRIGAYAPPVTLPWGGRDRAFTPRLGRRLAGVLPGSRFVDVPGARTFVSLDAPDELTDVVAGVTAGVS